MTEGILISTEINETSTTEEVNDYVEEVVKQAEADRVEHDKSDAQIVSEHAGQPAVDKTPAETESGNETVEQDEVQQDEDTGTSQSTTSWFDDDTKAEVAAYGIEEAELADFASREELDRALRLFDKSALDAGRKALAEGRNEKGQFTKKEEPESGQTSEPGEYKQLDKDVYDEEIAGNLDHFNNRIAALEARLLESDTVAKERHFDHLVDSLGHADLFGKTDKETAKEKQRREDLFVEVETYLAGRATLGRPAEMNDAIMLRVARSLFADEFGKKELKKRTRAITKQSNGRQGGGATRAQDPREDPRDEADRLYRQLSG